MSVMRFGNVCNVDASRGYVRVELDEDNITTHWLPVVVPGSRSNKYFAMPVINEQVVCLLDKNCEDGVVIGSLYSDVDKPDGFESGVSGVIFEDGSKVTYDAESATITVSAAGNVVIEAAEKISIRTEAETLKSILSDLIDQILAETHPTSSGPTGLPINSPQYAAIKTRVENFFE